MIIIKDQKSRLKYLSKF